MVFIGASNEPTMILMLTNQDVNDMRGGRTKYVDKTATKGFLFDKVVISVHKNQAEIEDIIRASGHGKVLAGELPSVQPSAEQVVCSGCNGNMLAYLVVEGKCTACWAESAKRYKQICMDEWGKP